MDIDPNLDISSFTHTHLYDHKFDVDQIIHALCGGADVSFTGRFLLDTENKQLIKDSGTYKDMKEGDLNGHIFEIVPLPLESLKPELTSHMMLSRLNEEDRTAVLAQLESSSHVAELCPLFEKGTTGGWLRERIKEKAMEWLDARHLIPPSMTHVYDGDIYNTQPAKTQIKFTEE